MEVEASFSSISPPVFDGENYQMWAVRKETYLEALYLWEAVEEDYIVPEIPANPTLAQIKAHKEKKMKKAKAKSCLFAAVSATIFTRIMSLKSTNEIWDYLKAEYEGDERIRGMRVLNLVHSRIMEKILVTLPEKFESTVTTLDNIKDLSKIPLAELLSALQAQEQRHAMRQEGTIEGALAAKHHNNGKQFARRHIKAHKEKKMKKAKAKSCLFAAVSATIFTRIMSLKSTNEIWDYLKAEYEGDERIRGIIANRVRLLGSSLADSRIVEKILVTLPEKFESTVTTLDNIKDLSKIPLEELLSALQEQEQRHAMRQEGTIEGALTAKHHNNGKNRKQKFKQPHAEGDNSKTESKTTAGNRKPGKKEEAKVADQEEEDQMFVAASFVGSESNESWLIDSGCTNHMTHDKELFRYLKPTNITKVRIGNGDYISVKGNGTIAIASYAGTKLIQDVLFVPEIDQNLLSVGQLIEKGFKVIFEDEYCLIKDANNQDIFKVKMKGKSFSLNPLEEEQSVFSLKEDVTQIWHNRVEHYHHQGLLQLREKELALDVPKLSDAISSCKACQFGKQNRKHFPKSTWRATHKLQLIHTDVSGPQRTPSLKEATNTVVFLQNRLPTKAVKDQTPFEAWKASPGIFIGYSNVSKAYKTFQPQTGNIVISRNVHFVEDEERSWDDAEKKGQTVAVLNHKFSGSRIDEEDDWQNETVDDAPVRGPRWIAAMEEELPMIEKNKTWILVDRPQDRKVIGVKWVFRTKLNADGSINKHKARLVVIGYAQIFGVDYSDAFAPVARLDTIRLLLAIEEIYVEQPQGFVKEDEGDKVYLLKKALYGLKQAPRDWKQYRSYSNFKQEMMKVFEMTNLGFISYFLVMEIKQWQGEVFICQKKYAKEILKKFQMEECKATNTPINQREKLCKEDVADKVDEGYFRSLIGCLMYLTATRPNILNAVSILSRFMHCASELHLKAAKRVIRYVKGTSDFGIKFKRCKEFKLVGFSDSDWGGSIDDMRSTSGYCFTLGSGVFSWSSKKKEIVAQSTVEAEFIAATTTVNQALWLRKILLDLDLKQKESTEIFVDNQAAIAISHNPVFHGKTKHFNIKLFFLREVQNHGDVILV
ncbi:hypothetical protein F3Y22_tig00003435pilonHSYRG00123 [Hibiscus syriacus]|uniref:Uncharacterized protein n=1 Tax=Hibiscus syriacus TaxID=106335 RepID=A0A6A3CJY1_HIBSY|nr:hypothetical protein F3Y22_tig00003435pilonHSYRG00123 [Hibiscus syriacus]